jgi:SAM-dependent methyltransferase
VSWEEQADNWIAWARSPDDSYWFYREAFFELLPDSVGAVVELGCGEGRVTRDLAARGYRVSAVDASPSLVAAAREADAGGEYVVADAAELPFADASFDLAISYNSLMDMDDVERPVREVWRVLRPGARFCLCVTHPVNDAGRFEHDEPGARFLIDVYRGRRPYDETIEFGGREMRFVSWCYPLEGYTQPLEETGFVIEAIREPQTDPARLETRPRAERRLRIPNFLMLRALKPA